MPNYKRKLNREQYRSSHPLLRFRKISPNMVKFVGDSLTAGTVLSVDSCPWTLKISCDQIYELKTYQHLFKSHTSIKFLNSIVNVPQDICYDNLLLCGIAEFKYRSWQQAVDTAIMVARHNCHRLILSLPITVMFFHRLKHSYHDIIDQIIARFDQQGWHCQSHLLDIDVVYFCLDKK